MYSLYYFLLSSVHRTAPGSGMSPFSRYGTAFNAPGSPFGMSPFATARDLPPLGPLHDPWGRLTGRAVPGFPAPVPQPPWGLKPDPAVIERREQEERERERERERLRREREERERREREEKQRKQLEQQVIIIYYKLFYLFLNLQILYTLFQKVTRKVYLNYFILNANNYCIYEI